MKLVRDTLYGLSLLVASPVLAWRLVRTGKWRTDWPGRLGRVDYGDVSGPGSIDPRPSVLIHGVSVGEVNATRTLVDELLRDDMPAVRVTISATTDTGFRRARELYGDRLEVVRFPLDFSIPVQRFLDAVRPDVVVLMELELWPNLCSMAEAREIPLVVVNGRLSAGSFRNYRLVRPLVRSMFGRIDVAAVQNEIYAKRFAALGVSTNRIHVTDTMKWDTALLADSVEGAEELAESLGIDRSEPLIVAGSTGPGEEAALLAACPGDVQLLLVPRKPERFEQVAALDRTFVRRTQRVAAMGDETASTKSSTVQDGGERSYRFLLDTMGELRKAYALADVVIIGRSFQSKGGSDPIEAVGLGRPTIIGPHFEHFASVVEALLEGQGIVVSDDPVGEALRLIGERDAADALGRRGRAVIQAHRGASGRNAQLIRSLLPRA